MPSQQPLPTVSVASRGFAFLIDWHIRAFAAVLAVVGTLLLAEEASWVEAIEAMGFDSWLLPAALYFLYHPVLEVLSNGTTPGKKYLGMVIVNKEGQPASLLALFFRNVFRLIDSFPLCYSLGLLCCIFNKQQNRLGDSLTGTRLVYADQLLKPQVKPGTQNNAHSNTQKH